MAALNFEDIVAMHVDEFGVEPVITGMKYASQEDLIDEIIGAINLGIPYVEQEVPDGALT